MSSGAAVALISTLPLAIALWSGLLEKWPGREQWLAIVIGLVGTLVMIAGADLRASPGGTALVLFATVTWSLGTVLSRRLDVPQGAMGFAAEMLAGGVLVPGDQRRCWARSGRCRARQQCGGRGSISWCSAR